MNNDIKKLIERFMAGQTSVEEEDMLAEYFRNNEVDDELKAYKEMFGWFDKGMPLEPHDTKQSTRRKRHFSLMPITAAAAIIILLITIVWQTGNNNIETTPVQPIQTASMICENKKSDSIAADTITIQRPKAGKTKRRLRKDTYRIMPPKTYLAQNEHDSISRQTDKELEEIYKKQEEIIREIEELYNHQNMSVDIIMASLTEDMEEETEETIN